ncbi:MAG: protein-export chaperone SecB [Bauldia sp.]|nr:protein-export chaperone SecB [Bauldia sp.]
MADNEQNGAGAGAPTLGPIPGADGPRMNILAQYVKDFSFENPDGPRVIQARDQGSRINVGINVTSAKTPSGDWEVAIKFDCTAKDGERTMFAIELLYCGIARFANVPDAQIEPLCMIEVPRMLFPFARQILADATRNGGFLPLMLDPVDFASMYRQRQQRAAGVTAPPPANLS